MRPGRAREPWRDDLVEMLVRQTVLENAAWRDVFNSAKDTLKKKYHAVMDSSDGYEDHHDR